MAQVADKSGEQRRAARIERAEMELDREDRSVLALAEQGLARADERILPGTLATKDEVATWLLVGRWDEHADIAPDHFFGTIAEQPGRGGLNDRMIPDRSITTMPSETVSAIEAA